MEAATPVNRSAETRALKDARHTGKLLEERTAFADRAIAAVTAEYLEPKLAIPFAVAALGGYGRRELFPFSDIDLLVLVGREADIDVVKEPLSNFLRALWDQGLRVSHSVRTPAECGHLHEGNMELHISLLDRRFLSGRRELFEVFSQKLDEVYNRLGATVIRRLVEMARSRHEKFNNTVYHLEPNIKDAPGGIRDIHVLRWLAQLLPHHEAIRNSVAELSAAVDFLFSLRSFIHLQSGRDNNLLTFELQDQIARSLAAAPLAPEEWMRRYYQHARHIFRSVLRGLEIAETQDSSLLRQFRDWRSRLSTSEFTVAGDRIYLRNPVETLSSAESALRLFSFIGRHGLRLSWDTQRRIQTDRGRLAAAFRDKVPGWTAWRDFLSQPHASIALEEMQETGLLTAALPEWQAIDSLVVRDFYHRYTVDEHTFVAIRVLDDLFAKKPGTPVRFQNLATADSDHALLRLALLLHDIGKGTAPGEHVRGSLECAAALFDD